ncbi:hypothetical protein [Agrobacterium vitis]|uniref:hypothetical protein n=1 Tax=Agrobacterium vitis TaxID=373 RepID=UPI0012E8D167|nr:hypothetical protein [Agrobacterium vitis]MVA60795.1 hypothetical protein [Agrobacterium vitis]BCH66054.1 hypothetical protein RvVAT039_32700 [Agrobacterium vitis]
MQASLVIMTILGCNDSVSQCQYIATAEQRWVSVELCNRDSENVLGQYSNVNFPSVVAFCQQQTVTLPQTTVTAVPATPTDPVPEAEKRSLADRAINSVKQVLPGKEDIKMVFTTPVHVVTDTYAWAAKKLTK